MRADTPVAQRPVSAGFYELPPRAGLARIKGRLRQGFTGLQESCQKQTLAVFDSFDWRLFGRDCLLVRQDGALRLVDLTTDEELAALAWEDRRHPRFWWDIDPCLLREKLEPILGVRALMVRLKLARTITTIRVLNDDQKTVARIAVESIRGRREGVRQRRLRTCTLSAVRGYPQEFAVAAGALLAAGLRPSAGHSLATALRQAGLNPGTYTTKPSLPLPPEMAAERAGRKILTFLGGIMAANAQGIRRDIDSEFLHDFRVAVRRARSLIGLIRQALDPTDAGTLAADLKTIGQATNALRDLDVYGLNRDRYKAMLPEPLQTAIDPLFGVLKKRRQKEKKAVDTLLGSPEYQSVMVRLCGDTQPAGGPAAVVPIGDLARRVILRRFKRVVKTGRPMVADGATEQALHGLRIQCKKLRYALEFFAALIDAEQGAVLIRQLKNLQDFLGRINDLAVQQRFLYTYLRTLSPRTKDGLAQAAAVGALIGHLHLEQEQLRAGFGDAFAGFDTKDNRHRYRQLFGQLETAP